VESRAENQTEMFECEAQTVIASTDTEKKKKNQGSGVFSQGQMIRVLPKNIKPNNPSNNLMILIIIGQNHYFTYMHVNELN